MTEQQKGVISRVAANYQFPSPQLADGVACAECIFYRKGFCHIVAGPVAEAAWCDYYNPVPDDLYMGDEDIEGVAIDMVEYDDYEEKHDNPGDKTGVFERAVNVVKNALIRKPADSAFTVWKSDDGAYMWLAIYSNNFIDHDEEIISEASHKRYVARVNAGFVPMPELWVGHIEGTRHGQATLMGYSDGNAWAVGTFDDTPEAKTAAKTYMKNPGKFSLSHGFTFPDWGRIGNVFVDHNTFEISTLPQGVYEPANPHVVPIEAFLQETQPMALTDKQKAAIAAAMGDSADDVIERIESAGDKAQKLKEDGVSYKAEFADFADNTDEGDDTETKARGSEGYADVLNIVLEQQAELLEAVEGLRDGVKARDTKRDKELSDAVKAFNKVAAQFKGYLQDAPRRITEGTAVTDDEAQAVKDRQDRKQDEPKTIFGIPVKD